MYSSSPTIFLSVRVVKKSANDSCRKTRPQCSAEIGDWNIWTILKNFRNDIGSHDFFTVDEKEDSPVTKSPIHYFEALIRFRSELVKPTRFLGVVLLHS